MDMNCYEFQLKLLYSKKNKKKITRIQRKKVADKRVKQS